ncbi:DNA alkylation repair protein [Candidatus Woesearchaeota archaeon]|nr:DNA alkylation repair protein [Candidatus Woesearchaeota archaeon]
MEVHKNIEESWVYKKIYIPLALSAIMLISLQQDLAKLADAEKAELYAKFFKTGKGEYGEGDKFLGIVVPEQREAAKKYSKLSLSELQQLLSSNIHEYRLTALFILINKYQKATETEKKELFDFYLKNTKNINNWDLVDSSAPYIVGDYLLDKGDTKKSILYQLAKSVNLWERRIAILSTQAFIRKEQFDDTLKIAEILLNDNHDLIHKAVGWMLREIGNRNQEVEEEFLKKHYTTMPRTMLRYAIEKFEENKRKPYLYF